jgi:hypothetical protein
LHDRPQLEVSPLRCAIPCEGSIPYISYYRCLTVRVSLFPGKPAKSHATSLSSRSRQVDSTVFPVSSSRKTQSYCQADLNMKRDDPNQCLRKRGYKIRNRNYSQMVGREELFERDRHSEPVPGWHSCELACAGVEG